MGLAEATLESRKVPGAPMVVLPPTEETEYSERGRMAQICDQTLDRFVKVMVAEKPSRALQAEA